MKYEKIGNFIRNLRLENNMTQDEFAKIIFVSRNNLSDIENGKTLLSPDKAMQLANRFKITVSDIYNGEITDEKDIAKIEETLSNVSETIIKENKKKYNKKLLCITIIFTTIILLFLVYYFLYSYNSVKVYKVVGESENFNTNDGLFFVSKENLYLSLSVESKNDKEIKSITLKYAKDNEDTLVQQIKGGNSFFIADYYGYNEYFNYDDIVKDNGKFYIIVEYDDTEEIIDLSLAKQYENNNLLLKPYSPIAINDGMTYTTKELVIPEKILNEFTYDEEGSSYSYQKKLMIILCI